MIKILKSFDSIINTILERKISLPEDYKNVNKIVICAVGGSAIAGDVINEAFELELPIIINRKYELPKFVDKNSLVISISYSGNTIETLIQTKEAIKRKCKIVGICSGGKLEKVLKNYPIIKIEKNLVPRFAFPHLLASLIKILNELEFIKLKKLKIKKVSEKKARKIAKILKEKFPIILSSYFSVAKRFKDQLNENSKTISKFEVLPEASHNEIESWKNLNNNYILIFLRDLKNENKFIKRSYEFFKKIAKTEIIEIFAEGKLKIERILNLIWFCDFVSYYLALEKNEIPEENEIIKKYKDFVYK